MEEDEEYERRSALRKRNELEKGFVGLGMEYCRLLESGVVPVDVDDIQEAVERLHLAVKKKAEESSRMKIMAAEEAERKLRAEAEANFKMKQMVAQYEEKHMSLMIELGIKSQKVVELEKALEESKQMQKLLQCKIHKLTGEHADLMKETNSLRRDLAAHVCNSEVRTSEQEIEQSTGTESEESEDEFAMRVDGYGRTNWIPYDLEAYDSDIGSPRRPEIPSFWPAELEIPGPRFFGKMEWR
ncbi:hypothetical protein TWF696_009747 [Orbilia brochopaga]|uniref:Uncharacterized protein n=1 Tax=Orbilia brochopaga TaxID=3140254 RepID=A0AAV9UF78_9PEZI